MRKVKNVPVIVRYTLVKVKLDKSYTDKFQLTYARGKDLNRSDLVAPNRDDIIIFNASGASACTFQIKPDGSMKNKKLKVVLHRFVDPATSRIYGHLVIDLTKYYHRGMEITDEIPMETAHTLSPILTFKCSVKKRHSKPGKSGKASVPSENNADDTLEDIDDSFEENYIDDSENSKKKKGKQQTGEQRPAESKYMTTSELMITDDETTSHHEQKAEQEENNEKEELEEEEEEEDKIEPPPENQNKSGANLVTALKRFSTIIQSKTVPTFKALAKPKEEPKIPVDEVFRDLLSHPIPPPMEYAFMDPDTNTAYYPGAVYPLYQTIFKSKLFIQGSFPDDEFRNAINIFYEKFPTAPLSEDPPPPPKDEPNEKSETSSSQDLGLVHESFKDDFDPYFAPNEQSYTQHNESQGASIEQRFLTTLIILILTSQHSAQYGYSPERTSDFTNHLVSFMNIFARQIFGHYLADFEKPITELAMGRFNQTQLLDEFINVYDSVIATFKFLPSVNKYITNCFNNSLDALIFNKILSNPARFTFSKAAIWNSFFTALKSAKSLQFPLTIQLVSCLMMAINIATEQPKDGEEELRIKICPDLDPKLIIYILKNYRPDNMNEMSINYRLTAQRLNVSLKNLRFVPISPQDNNDYQGAGDSIRINDWNKGTPNAHLVSQYPFMKQSKKA